VSNKNNYLKKNCCIFLLTVGHAKLFKLAKNENGHQYDLQLF